jgi:DNA-binding IclR family transcriptional regulator
MQKPRPALSATRALEVLDFFAARPGEAFTLSELARALGVNVSSTYSILYALETAGYVLRDPSDKRYRLGIVPIVVGHVALEAHPVVQRGREVAEELAERLGLECVTGANVGPELLIVGAAGPPERLRVRPRVGMRLPITPAVSAMSAAYATADEVEAWLDRLGPGATRAARDHYRARAAAVRARGYEVGLETPTRYAIGEVLAKLAHRPRNRALRRTLAERLRRMADESHDLLTPHPSKRHPVNNITAPIFDHRGRCVGGLAILGFDQPLNVREIEGYARAVVTAADTITHSTGGKRPPERDLAIAG